MGNCCENPSNLNFKFPLMTDHDEKRGSYQSNVAIPENTIHEKVMPETGSQEKLEE